MLQLRPGCECCNRDLPRHDEARIMQLRVALSARTAPKVCSPEAARIAAVNCCSVRVARRQAGTLPGVGRACFQARQLHRDRLTSQPATGVPPGFCHRSLLIAIATGSAGRGFLAALAVLSLRQHLDTFALPLGWRSAAKRGQIARWKTPNAGPETSARAAPGGLWAAVLSALAGRPPARCSRSARCCWQGPAPKRRISTIRSCPRRRRAASRRC